MVSSSSQYLRDVINVLLTSFFSVHIIRSYHLVFFHFNSWPPFSTKNMVHNFQYRPRTQLELFIIFFCQDKFREVKFQIIFMNQI